MAVYVDDMLLPAKVGRISSRWSHLTADTPEELHAFAQRLGLKRSWFQRPKGYGGKPVNPTSLRAQMWHYDVTENKRLLALSLGAIPITTRESVAIMKRRHQLLFPPEEENPMLPIDW